MPAFHLDNLIWKVTRDLAAAEPTWSQLEYGAPATPFQRYAWIAAWYDAIGRQDGAEIAIVCAFANDRPVALFPLAVERKAGMRCLTWAAHRWNDYNAPLLAPEMVDAITKDDVGPIWRQVINCIGGVDLAQLDKQPSQIAGRPNPFAGYSATPEATSAHAVRLGSDWPSFASSQFNRATLRRLREKENRLEKIGTLRFTRIMGSDEKAKAIKILLEWKHAQLNECGARNPFCDARVASFLADAACDASEFVEIHALELDGNPIAIVLALTRPDGLLVYQTAYGNGPLARHSPGRILLNRLMEKLICDGQTILDLSLGNEGYKAGLCNIHLDLHCTIRAYSLSGIVPAVILRGRLSIERWVKARPRLLGALQTAHKYARKIWIGNELTTSDQQAPQSGTKSALATERAGIARPEAAL